MAAALLLLVASRLAFHPPGGQNVIAVLTAWLFPLTHTLHCASVHCNHLVGIMIELDVPPCAGWEPFGMMGVSLGCIAC